MEQQLVFTIISCMSALIVFLLGLLVASMNGRLRRVEELKANVETVDVKFVEIQNDVSEIRSDLRRIFGIIERRREFRG
jgi:hypothetical protein